jgi:hypothetical protein
MKVQLWHRRHAMMLAGQLPEHHDDAMAVLCLTMDLVQEFLSGEQDEPEPAKRPTLTIVPIGGDERA